MSYDFIEIALEKYTDFSLFERLATEIMHSYGFSTITSLGGSWDEGQDAIEVRHYTCESSIKTVFQYSLQENVAGKITNTLEKLKKNGIEYDKLIIVTNRVFTAQQHIRLRQKAIKEYKKELEIFDKEKLIPILGDKENGLMVRYFPDIKKQVEKFFSQTPDQLTETKEASFLRTCSIFYYDKDSELIRKEFIDKLIVEILAKTKNPIQNIPDLVSIINSRITSRTIDDVQANNALARLKIANSITDKNGITLTVNKRAQLINTESKIKENVNSLIQYILQNISKTVSRQISQEEEGFLRANSLKVIVACFHLYGSDIAKQLSNSKSIKQIVDITATDITNCAKKNISDELGNLLVAEIAELFFKPTPEQYDILSDMCRSYLASVILSIDPVLSEFQTTKIGAKIFILDTDFILDSINNELPQRRKNKTIIENLQLMGSRIVIPRNCVVECINHAKIAYRTYEHFRETLLSLPSEFVEQHVWNVFVKGFYYFKKEKPDTKINFNEYTSNYYESENDYSFMVDVIKSKLSNKVEIIQQRDLFDGDIPEKEINELGDTIFAMTKDSRKAKYRTPEEMKEISNLDAELYLIALKLNTDETSTRGGILSQQAYIISESNRYIRAVSGTDKYKNIVIRSYSIYSLLRLIGTVKKPRDEMDTLADPLLSKIVFEMWDDVERLILNGIRLDNMEITRLRWDFDKKLHERLIKIDEMDLSDDTLAVGKEDDYIELIKSFKEKGYSLVPQAEQLVEMISSDKREIEQLQSEKKKNEIIIANLLQTSEAFGKKKQKYLKRMMNRTNLYKR